MSWGEWFLLGCVAVVAVTGAACLILSINESSEAEDAEQRRKVGQGDDWSAEQMRKDGLL